MPAKPINIDIFEERLQLIKESIKDIKEKVVEIDKSQNHIDNILTDFDKKIDRTENLVANAIREWIWLKENQEVMKNDISEIRKGLDGITRRLDDYEKERKEGRERVIAAKKRRTKIILAIITAGGTLIGSGVKLLMDYFEAKN